MKARLLILILLCTLFWSQQSLANEPDSPGEPSDLETHDREIEEITVISQKTLLSLRYQIIRAEDRVFEVFNKLNDDDKYDIHCFLRAPTGTRIKQRDCAPNYYRNATADQAKEFLGGPPAAPVNSVIAYHGPILRDKMVELIKENPELVNAMVDYYELKQELEQKHNDYYRKKDE